MGDEQQMTRIIYLALGLTVGCVATAVVLLMVFQHTIDNPPSRYPIPLAWEGITDSKSLGV